MCVCVRAALKDLGVSYVIWMMHTTISAVQYSHIVWKDTQYSPHIIFLSNVVQEFNVGRRATTHTHFFTFDLERSVWLT